MKTHSFGNNIHSLWDILIVLWHLICIIHKFHSFYGFNLVSFKERNNNKKNQFLWKFSIKKQIFFPQKAVWPFSTRKPTFGPEMTFSQILLIFRVLFGILRLREIKSRQKCSDLDLFFIKMTYFSQKLNFCVFYCDTNF